MDRRAYAPGQHGQGRKKTSEYGIQLREKQKVRRIYGILERQFSNYFDRAERQPGITGENLLRILERRLDNVVYRLGFADSRAEARQLVRHNHFTIDGHKANIPSILVEVGNVIAIKEKSLDSVKFQGIKENLVHKTIPAWLEVDGEPLTAKVVAMPTRDQIDLPVEEHLIVELYSR